MRKKKTQLINKLHTKHKMMSTKK